MLWWKLLVSFFALICLMQPKSILYTCSSQRLLLDITKKKIANNSCVGGDGRGEKARASLLLFPQHYMCTFIFPSLCSLRPLQGRKFLSMESFPSKFGLAGQITLDPLCTYDFLLSSHVRHRLNPCLCSLGIGGWRILWQTFGSLWLFIFRQGATFKIFSCNITPFSCY